jgi:NosR/NirI family nitrous oxide reductase transcriptional regulator
MHSMTDLRTSSSPAIKAMQLLLALIFLPSALHAESDDLLQQTLDTYSAGELFPGADRIGTPEGEPLAAAAYSSDEQIGLLFLNSAVVNAMGYSGKPIHVLVGLDNQAVIQAVRMVKHHEPIVLVGIPESKINALIDGYVGLDLLHYIASQGKDQRFDAISGATVTVRVIDDSIIRSAIKMARQHSIAGLTTLASGPKAEIDLSVDEVLSWTDLLTESAVGRLQLSVAQINQGFIDDGAEAAIKRPEPGPDDATFIDMYAAQVSIPSIGRSLLGEAEYRNLEQVLEPGQQAVLLAGQGRYSFKGSGYVRGGIFDRFEIIQGDDAIRFTDMQHKRLRRVAADGAPQDLSEVELFVIPEDSQLDPGKPWHLQLLVSRETGPRDKAFLTYDLDYRVPERYLKFEAVVPEAEEIPLWQQLWQEKRVETGILIIAITFLTAVFFFQDQVAAQPGLAPKIRIGFLLFTLFFIGFYANAQLSVVNILTVFSAAAGGFNWEYFLMEPLIFILWGGVIAGLIFWGRGAYCGWLCPFGALQELLNKVAKIVRVPQVTLPWGLHERLWPIKYLIFLGLFGVSLHSLELAERLAEVEPFKTAIILKFVRDWPYVLFALAMLLPGLFIERFYCRYLCPLGAALAIPGRMRTMAWLKRYRQCGNPCQVCSKECMVQAIHPEGHINPNECLYCLHCQERYYDDHNCPVRVKKRERADRQAMIASTETTSLGTAILEELRGDKK